MNRLRDLWNSDHRPAAGTVVFLVLLLLMTGLSVVSAMAFRSLNESRTQTADKAIREYASLGARLFADRAFGVFEGTRVRILSSIYGARPRPGEAAPSFARFVEDASREMDAIGFALGDANRGFFVFDVNTGAYVGEGAASRDEVRNGVLALLRDAPPARDRRMEPMVWLITELPELLSMASAPLRDSKGRVLAVYGYTYTRTAGWKSVGDAVMRDLPLVPASFIQPGMEPGNVAAGNDSLIAIRLIDQAGGILYDSRPPYPGLGGESPRNTGSTVLRVQATLHPTLLADLRLSLKGSNAQVFWAFTGSDGAVKWRFPLPLDSLLPLVSLLFAVFAGVALFREQKLTRARRDFVASVSHELRTPLAQIRMFTETLLLRRERDDEERTHWLGIVSRESRRLGDLVENILLFSHIDADRVRIEKERTDLGELIEEVVEGYVQVAAQRGMRIVADAPSRIFALVDPRAMRQVVVNLIDNALKYGPRGQVVNIELERVADRARLTVSDQGPGVPITERKRVWEPFVRLGDRGTTGGSGIGLSVVRDLVLQHGGTIEVGDAPGGGAKFVVELAVSESSDGLPMRATGEFRAREVAAARAASSDLRAD